MVSFSLGQLSAGVNFEASIATWLKKGKKEEVEDAAEGESVQGRCACVQAIGLQAVAIDGYTHVGRRR